MTSEFPDIRKVYRRFERWRSAHTGACQFPSGCGPHQWNWLESTGFPAWLAGERSAGLREHGGLLHRQPKKGERRP